MRLLIIGGSVFLGRALAAEARTRGHELTLFNRGLAMPTPEHGVKLIRGDRNGDLQELQGGTWDAVMDTCGYFPRQVRCLLATLAGRVGHYTFVSTVSAYADLSRSGLTEADVLGRIADETTETVTMQTYGPLKALGEAAAEQALPGRTLIVRPGIIAGPFDPTDRFAYWVERLAQGGEVLAPGDPARAVQLIDVRDLAMWILAMVETRETGVFNAVGPCQPHTFGELLAGCAQELNPASRLVWVEDGFLRGHGLAEWTKLPLYVPALETQLAGLFSVNGAKAWKKGLKLRPFVQTAADTWRWMQSRAGGAAVKNGLERAQEQALLTAWRARS